MEMKQKADSLKTKMSNWKPDKLHKAQRAQTTACDYRFGDVRSAATFQTFCFGRGFSEARHFRDKISLQRGPLSLLGLHYKHLLFRRHTFHGRFTSLGFPPLPPCRGRNEPEREIQESAHHIHHMTSLLSLHTQAKTSVSGGRHQSSTKLHQIFLSHVDVSCIEAF